MSTIIVNGHTIPWEDGMTVRRVLQVMNYSFRMLVIKIDGKVVNRADYDHTLVPAGSDVMVYHMISGG